VATLKEFPRNQSHDPGEHEGARRAAANWRLKGTEGEANEDQDTGALGVRNTCVDVTDRGQRPILVPPGNHRLFGRVLRGHLQPERSRSNKAGFCVGSRQHRGQVQSVHHRGCPVESRGAASGALRILLDRGLHTRACILLLI